MAMDDSDLLIGALVVGGLYLATRDTSSSSTPQQTPTTQASNAGCNGVMVFGVCVPQSVIQQGANAVSAFIASLSAGSGGGANYAPDEVQEALDDLT